MTFGLSLFACAAPAAQKQISNSPPALPSSSPTSTDSAPKETQESRSPTPPTSEISIQVEEVRVQVVDADAGKSISFDARSIFDEANDALASDDFAEALRGYDHMVNVFPESSLASAARFNAGLALEGLGKVDEAVERYLALSEIAGEAKGEGSEQLVRDGIDATIRAAALYAENERWTDCVAILDKLAEQKITVADRVEVLARRGYALAEARDFTAAETSLRQAMELYDEKIGGKDELASDYYGGMARFYLGDIARRQFEEIPIRLPESQMGRDVEAKATLVLLAGDRFADTIRFGNMYWATAAGFRLAQMQRSFWSALVAAPVPPHLNAQAAEIYVEEVHKHALNLLEKSLSIHRKNVELAKVYRAESDWSRASKREVAALTELIGRERAGEIHAPEVIVATRRPPNAEYLPGRYELP